MDENFTIDSGDADFVDFSEILRTYNQGDIALLKSILNDNEIVYYFKGENFNTLRPLIEPTSLMVRYDQASEVKELLKDFFLFRSGIRDQDRKRE